jgi:Methyltransferase domain
VSWPAAPGGVGWAAAQWVGPAGAVVLSDVAGEMVAVAAVRAEAVGLANVTFRQLGLERIDEPDASYDVIVCGEGLARCSVRRGHHSHRYAGAAARHPWPVLARPRQRARGAVVRRRAHRRHRQRGGDPLRVASFEEWWTVSPPSPKSSRHSLRPSARRSTSRRRRRSNPTSQASAWSALDAATRLRRPQGSSPTLFISRRSGATYECSRAPSRSATRRVRPREVARRCDGAGRSERGADRHPRLPSGRRDRVT